MHTVKKNLSLGYRQVGLVWNRILRVKGLLRRPSALYFKDGVCAHVLRPMTKGGDHFSTKEQKM